MKRQRNVTLFKHDVMRTSQLGRISETAVQNMSNDASLPNQEGYVAYPQFLQDVVQRYRE